MEDVNELGMGISKFGSGIMTSLSGLGPSERVSPTNQLCSFLVLLPTIVHYGLVHSSLFICLLHLHFRDSLVVLLP